MVNKEENELIDAEYAKQISIYSIESAAYHWYMDNISKFNEQIIQQATKGFRRLAISVPFEYAHHVAGHFAKSKFKANYVMSSDSNGIVVVVLKW